MEAYHYRGPLKEGRGAEALALGCRGGAGGGGDGAQGLWAHFYNGIILKIPMEGYLILV